MIRSYLPGGESRPDWVERFPTRLVPVLVIVALLPFLAGPTGSGQIVVLMIFAVGFHFLFGYGGQMSFGHAAFYGLGAYGAVLSMTLLTPNPYLGVLVGSVLAAVVSLVVARISLFRRGVYFAMITLALGQLLYYVVLNPLDEFTGGEQGIYMPRASASLGPIDPMNGGMEFYLLAVAVLIVVWLVVRRVVNSPFGSVVIAIRENEQRVEHLGLEPDRFLVAAFGFSALLSGLAGGLYAMLFQFVTPNLLFWSLSGTIMLVTILGGTGSLNGPIFGALVFQLLSQRLSDVAPNWPLFFGALFVLVVLYAPRGIQGLLADVYQRLREQELPRVSDADRAG
jgi:branched-chain amino acid transport system permease protein